MTDTADEPREDDRADDYEYDEAHGGGDSGPAVPAAIEDEARRMKDLSPHGGSPGPGQFTGAGRPAPR